jgi:DNA-binding transcriptional ArsR family regulator
VSTEASPTEDQPPQDYIVLDGPALRALSHPVRNRILTILRKDGPSTSSLLARALGLNSGATSYHLRQLADAGLITDDDSRGNRRDRWWKAVYRSSTFDETSFAADPEAAMAYLNSIAGIYAERVIDFGYRMPQQSPPWDRAGDMSDYLLRLTPAEATRLKDQLHALVSSFRRENQVLDGTVKAPRGSRVVSVQFQVMPEADPPAAVPKP